MKYGRIKSNRSCFRRLVLLLTMIGYLSCSAPSKAATLSDAEVVGSLRELAGLAGSGTPRNIQIELEGTVLWSSASTGRIILQDTTETIQLELHLPCEMPELGDRLRVEGECTVVKARDAIVLSSVPVVENNGLHGFTEKAGKMYLEAGKHPVQLAWFNRTELFGLEVEYEGPGIPRQPIPDAELFRIQDEPSAGETNAVNGLSYHCFEGQWWRLLPSFDHLDAVRSGVVDNFDISVRSRDAHVGLQFSGYINIQREGAYTFYVSSDDGSRLFVGPPTLRIHSQGSGPLPAAVPPAMRSVSSDDPEFQWSEIEGDVLAVHRSGESLKLELMTEVGVVSVKVARDASGADTLKPHQRIRLAGVSRRVFNLNGKWVPGEFFVQSLEDVIYQTDGSASGEEGGLRLLTTIGQVYQLSREESSKKYPVKVRGVITSPMENNGAVLQDAAQGIYMALNGPINLQVGDYCEVEGTTGPYTFSHYIEATRVEVLGVGTLPEPVIPSWDQLINGSLHCNYVELEGVVVSIEGNWVALLTRGGRINVRLNPAGAPMPDDALGAIIRLRGCLLADWDGASRRVMVGSIYLDQHWVNMVDPAPADPFAVGYKPVGDLLQFDPEAGALQRVRVYGMLIHKDDTICCLMDGNNGLRFLPAGEIDAEVGDMVDVSGFLELGGPSPVLREAIVRKTSRGKLPEPHRLEAQNLVRDELDSSYVKAEGVLLDISEQPGQVILELQNGLRRFMAELTGEAELDALSPGCRLEVTGAYIGLGGQPGIGAPDRLL